MKFLEHRLLRESLEVQWDGGARGGGARDGLAAVHEIVGTQGGPGDDGTVAVRGVRNDWSRHDQILGQVVNNLQQP